MQTDYFSFSVLPGDFLGGSTYAAAHKGESVLEVLNELNVDYFTLGNHEFDFGATRVGELMDKSNFKWLGSNVRHADSGALFKSVLDTDVFEVKIGTKYAASNDSDKKDNEVDDIVRIGVFGVCTQFTPMLSDPGDNVIFEDVFEHSERCVSTLKKLECDYIIGLTHLELENDKRIAEALDINIIIGEWKSVNSKMSDHYDHRLKQSNKSILELQHNNISDVRPLYVLTGGHEHTPFYFTHSGTTVIKCGQNMDHLGILDLSFQRDIEGCVTAVHNFELLPTEGTKCCPDVDAVIKKWRDCTAEGSGGGDILCAVGDHVVSTLTSDLRCTETAFACMVADAIVDSYKEEGCQLAIQNGGFIRYENSSHSYYSCSEPSLTFIIGHSMFFLNLKLTYHLNILCSSIFRIYCSSSKSPLRYGSYSSDYH